MWWNRPDTAEIYRRGVEAGIEVATKCFRCGIEAARLPQDALDQTQLDPDAVEKARNEGAVTADEFHRHVADFDDDGPMREP